jgi:hypothetical protein
MQSANRPQPVIHCNATPTGLATTTAGYGLYGPKTARPA